MDPREAPTLECEVNFFMQEDEAEGGAAADDGAAAAAGYGRFNGLKVSSPPAAPPSPRREADTSTPDASSLAAAGQDIAHQRPAAVPDASSGGRLRDARPLQRRDGLLRQ